MYPFIFEPILKEVIWGGTDIRPYKGLPATDAPVGESWEISHVPGNESVVADGALKGTTLGQLVTRFGAQLLGHHVAERFGDRFPLLIKFIDARQHLSIQVHPDDEMARRRHNSFGKTEMWYVVKAAPGAFLYTGFAEPVDADSYVRRVADGTIIDALCRYDVVPGDLFFLPAGRVHAIGAGCFVAEIQQTSNVTYRIYDYKRLDANGNERELHTELAREAIDYTLHPDYRTRYQPAVNRPVALVQCKYFTTSLLEIDRPFEFDVASVDSFVIYMCLEGAAQVTDSKGCEVAIRQGQTLLVPADNTLIRIVPQPATKMLQVYVE